MELTQENLDKLILERKDMRIRIQELERKLKTARYYLEIYADQNNWRDIYDDTGYVEGIGNRFILNDMNNAWEIAVDALKEMEE